MSSHHPEKKHTLAAEIREVTGLNAAGCYQCGKCSAGCPMAGEMSLKPHDLMRLTQNDERARLFGDESIWLCLTCETCTARCPNECDSARVIDALRELALRHDPERAPREIRAFHQAFLDQIRAHGRVFELGLILQYKMTGGPLFQDALAAPGMLARGKLALSPRRIKGIAEIRRIFEACEPRPGEKT
jgi:heterodisulfide reductase subunit C